MNDPSDGKRLQDSWRTLAEDATGTSQVDNEAIWKAVAGEGSAEDRRTTVDVIASDPAAAESWRLAQELQRELAQRELAQRESKSEPHHHEERFRQAPFRPHQWIALAAILLLVLGFGLWRFTPSSFTGVEEPVFRDAATTELRSQVPEDVPQPRDSVTLSWIDSGTGDSASETHYTVRVLRPNLEPLVELRDLIGSSVQIPEDRLREVATEERLLWQVKAHRPNGQVVTSQTFFLYLAPATEGSTLSNNSQPEEP